MNDFVDFADKVRTSFRMSSAGAMYALRQIAEKASHNRESFEDEEQQVLNIDKNTLLNEFNTNLIPSNPISETQVCGYIGKRP